MGGISRLKSCNQKYIANWRSGIPNLNIVSKLQPFQYYLPSLGYPLVLSTSPYSTTLSRLSSSSSSSSSSSPSSSSSSSSSQSTLEVERNTVNDSEKNKQRSFINEKHRFSKKLTHEKYYSQYDGKRRFRDRKRPMHSTHGAIREKNRLETNPESSSNMINIIENTFTSSFQSQSNSSKVEKITKSVENQTTSKLESKFIETKDEQKSERNLQLEIRNIVNSTFQKYKTNDQEKSIEFIESIEHIPIPEDFQWVFDTDSQVKRINEVEYENFMAIITELSNSKEFRQLCETAHFSETFNSFRRFILKNSTHPFVSQIYQTILNNYHNIGALIKFLHPYVSEFTKSRFPQNYQLLIESRQYADLTNISKIYKEARRMKRKIIYHAGPTNSGKTHAAMKRLKEVEYGAYCAPLRLLAQEIFYKLNYEGVPCDLLTGQESRSIMESKHISLTIEMLNLNKMYDVIVIDEIQVISDEQRGKSWTRALLGACATEVHVCGDFTAINIVEKLCNSVGEELEVIYYERKNELKILPNSLMGDIKRIQERDCIIAFSRYDIHFIKKLIETHTHHKCCIIYGSLPSEVRKEQAEIFNDEKSGYTVLVSTDAIGMGLNLNIKRIVFWSMYKVYFRNMQKRALDPLLTKQIAGRAGRKGFYDVGYVTTFASVDYPILMNNMSKEVDPIEKAGIFPDVEMIEKFAKNFPSETPFSHILEKLVKLCSVHPDYFLCNFDDSLKVASLLDHLDLPLKVRYDFVTAPVSFSPEIQEKMKSFVECFAKDPNAVIPLQIEREYLHSVPAPVRLKRIEILTRMTELYKWLSVRYPIQFDPNVAKETKEMLIEEFNNCLAELTHSNERNNKKTRRLTYNLSQNLGKPT